MAIELEDEAHLTLMQECTTYSGPARLYAVYYTITKDHVIMKCAPGFVHVLLTGSDLQKLSNALMQRRVRNEPSV